MRGEPKYKFLLLEDSEADAELLRRHLSHSSLSHSLNIVDNPGDFERKLEETWDCIISDYDVPGVSAIAALEMMRARGLDVPFVIVSGQIGEEKAVEALRLGADDFVAKSNLTRLEAVLRRSIRESLHRKKETELRAAHEVAVRDREQLLAVVCHDLKNPLSSIQLTAQLLLSRTVAGVAISPEQLIRKLTQIDRSCTRIDRLLRDVLDQARVSAGHFHLEQSRANLNELLGELAEDFTQLASQQGVRLSVSNAPGDPSVVLDRSRILQVLSNLVSNALKFSPPGSEIRVTAQAEKGSTRFTVFDAGPGIVEKDPEKLFSKFYQSPGAEKKGTGLGLYIAREIIRNHHGEIGVDSAPGKGAAFWFTLPAQAPLGPLPKISESHRDVMIIDDDDDLRHIMRVALEDNGFRVREVATVSDAVQTLLNAEGRPNAIVVDYDLPGQTGAELVAWLSTQTDYKPLVVLISAHPDVYERAKEMGVAQVVQKPMKLNRLVDVIRDGIAASPPGTSLA